MILKFTVYHARSLFWYLSQERARGAIIGETHDEVFRQEIETENVDWALEYLYTEFNIHDDGVFGSLYRARELRSLSCGDVIAFGEMAWFCDSIGWTPTTLRFLEEARS